MKKFCSEVLTIAGYSVEVASNGIEAFGKLREAPYDLVITGMSLSGLDGIGLYLDTLKIYSNMREKFIFMEEESCAKETEAGDEPHIVKPFDVRELLRKVESLTGVNLTAYLMKYRNLGENRRAARRFCWTEDSGLLEDAHRLRPFAQTINVSRQGLRIRYMGSPVDPESLVRIEVKCLMVRGTALVVWSRTIDERESISGLKLAEPVSATAISAITQSRRPFIPPLVSGGVDSR